MANQVVVGDCDYNTSIAQLEMVLLAINCLNSCMVASPYRTATGGFTVGSFFSGSITKHFGGAITLMVALVVPYITKYLGSPGSYVLLIWNSIQLFQ